MALCLPAGNGNDTVPASAANAFSSTAPLSAFASFFHALLPAQLDFDPIGRNGDPIDYFLDKAF